MKGKEKKLKKEEPEVCQVCRWDGYNNEDLEKLKCQNCGAVVHKNCYQPDIR